MNCYYQVTLANQIYHIELEVKLSSGKLSSKITFRRDFLFGLLQFGTDFPGASCTVT